MTPSYEFRSFTQDEVTQQLLEKGWEPYQDEGCDWWFNVSSRVWVRGALHAFMVSEEASNDGHAQGSLAVPSAPAPAKRGASSLANHQRSSRDCRNCIEHRQPPIINIEPPGVQAPPGPPQPQPLSLAKPSTSGPPGPPPGPPPQRGRWQSGQQWVLATPSDDAPPPPPPGPPPQSSNSLHSFHSHEGVPFNRGGPALCGFTRRVCPDSNDHDANCFMPISSFLQFLESTLFNTNMHNWVDPRDYYSGGLKGLIERTHANFEIQVMGSKSGSNRGCAITCNCCSPPCSVGFHWWKGVDAVTAQRCRNLLMAYFNYGPQAAEQPMVCQADFFLQYQQSALC
jgi:hypothetical protein